MALKRSLKLHIFILISVMLVLSGPSATGEPDRNETEEFDFANGLFSRGMYDMAINGYREFLKKYPSSSYAELASYRIADSYFLSEEYDRSLSMFDDYLKKYPSGSMAEKARLRKGQVYFMKEDYGRAESILKPLAGRRGEGGSSSAALYYLAGMRFKQGEYTTSKNMLEKLLADTGGGEYASYAYMNLGDIYVETGNEKKAAEAYASAESKAPDAGTADEASVRAGSAFFKAGDYGKSAYFYGKVTERSEGNGYYDSAAVGLLTSLYKEREYGRVIDAARGLIDNIQGGDAKAQALFVLGNSYFQRDDFPRAEKVYRELSEKYPSTEAAEKAMSNECWTLFKTGDYAGCLASIEDYSGKASARAGEILYIKARALAALGRVREAIDVYAGMAKDPADLPYRKEAVYDIGWLLSESGDAERAVRFLRMFAEDYPGDKRSPAVLLKAGQEELKLKRFRAAEKDFNALVSKFPSSPLKENALYQLGGVYLEQEEYDKAIAAYTRFLDSFPSSEASGAAVYWMGLAYQRKEQWDKAIQTYSRLISDKKSEFYERGMEASAYCYFQKGDRGKAGEIYYRLMKDSPDAGLTAGVYRWVAEHYLKAGKYRTSLEVLEAFSRKYPDESSGGEVAYMLGENYYGLGEWGKAETKFREAIDKKAPSPLAERAYLGLGRSYFAQGDDKKAMAFLDEAIQGQTDNMTGALIRFEIGNVNFSMGNYQEAAKQYMMVAILYDEEELCSRALFRAGEAFEKAGMRERSLEAFKELVNRFPDNELSKKAVKKTGDLKDEA